MPNWVYNSLSIEGSKELIADVKHMLNKPFKKSHDSWNMANNQMEVSETAYSNPIFAFHNIYNHIQDGVSDEEYLKQPDHSLPLEESLMFKGNHWYDWNVRNWGTKWEVGVSDDDKYPETELMEEDETSLSYRLNTAWSPPVLNSILTWILIYTIKKKQVGVEKHNSKMVLLLMMKTMRVSVWIVIQ